MSVENPDVGNVSTAPERNYFVRHWHGDLSLPVSYWINGFLGFIISSLIVGIFVVASEDLRGSSGTPILIALALLLVPLMAVMVWQSVGIWRSASRHAGRGGHAGWANLAKIVVILGALRAIWDIGSTFVPLASEHAQIALGDKKFGESRFQLLRDGRELEFSGGINIGAAKKLDEALNAAPDVSVLHLNSSGGRLLEADLMAKLVQKRNLTTYVHTSCESACTHVFLAGRERWLGQRATLGFHRPSSGLKGNDSQDVVKDERAFLKSKNLSDSFISKALATEPDAMWHPTQPELQAAGIISGIADRNQFAMSGANASMSADRLAKLLVDMPMYAALKQHEPAMYDEIVQIMTKGFQRGSSEEEIASQGRAIIGKIAGSKIPYALDDVVLEFADVYIAYIGGLKNTDAASCVALFDNTKGIPMVANLQSMFPEAAAKELELNTRILQIKTAGEASKVDAEKADAYVSEVFEKLATQPALRLDVFAKEKLPPSEYGSYCEAVAALVTEIRRLPPDKAATVFRHIFAMAYK